ncbi:ABC transporter substrate-binding protein [Salininema proteolyticum]|uniref:ABC transporter substrate-binding protein n=1 Tax=Salininema proteolyticum TaxID=1607685 RepID=A0ABV8TYK4_9ACTN
MSGADRANKNQHFFRGAARSGVTRRLVGGLAATGLLLGLAACGGDSGGSDDGLVIGFVQVGAESAWRTANSESVRSSAGEDDRIAELKFIDGQQDQAKQLEGMRNLITQRVDAIVLAPVVETGWTEVLEEARDADIPVLLADRSVEQSDEDLYATRLGSDFVEEGRKAGAWVTEEFADADGTAVLELEGTVGSAPANDRKAGFYEVLDGEGFDYDLLDSQSGDFTAEGGKEVMEVFLQSHDPEDVDVLYAHNDEMGLGAIQAMEEAGVEPGEDVRVIIVDGSAAGFQAGADGKVDYIVECNPVFGDQLMDLAVDVVGGEDVDKYVPVEESAYGPDEFADELPNRQY